MSLPLGPYARIAPCLGLVISNFIDVGAGIVDLDYWGEIKVVLFNHSAEDFAIQANDRIALKESKLLKLKRWQSLMKLAME